MKFIFQLLSLSSKRINNNSNQNSNPVLTDMDVNKGRIDTNIQVVTTCFKSTSPIGFLLAVLKNQIAERQ